MIGLDIGGANLKAATSAGRTISVPFALWKNPDGLVDALRRLVAEFPGEPGLAVTMTGELCDCYASKVEGVRSILGAVAQLSKSPRIWTNAGYFVDLSVAEEWPLSVAAANWLALATYAGRLVPRGNALLLDLGSTTMDIIPLVGGQPVPIGRTDPERLASNELVYCGVQRTPLCAVFGLTKAAEFFATMEDAFLALGEIPEDPLRKDTADGRPATREFALARLARMECDDVGDGKSAMRIAKEARARHSLLLRQAVDVVAKRLPGRVDAAVIAGSGRFMLPEMFVQTVSGKHVPVRIVSLDESISTAACAYAVAVLAEEMS